MQAPGPWGRTYSIFPNSSNLFFNYCKEVDGGYLETKSVLVSVFINLKFYLIFFKSS
jgi:hypothetical protein